MEETGKRAMKRQPEEDTVLRMAGVGVVRGDVQLLSDVAWRVEKGQHWAILGPNGSGKTTLLRVAAGELYPSQGEGWLLGHRLGSVPVEGLRRRIGWVSPAISARFPYRLRVLEAVVGGAFASVGLHHHHVPGAEEEARARALISRFGLKDIESRMFGVLSQGERTRLMLARALMGEPELLVLDEPSAGLDLAARESFLASVQELTTSASSPTIVFVTHHLGEIVRGVTHVLLMAGGRVAAAGQKSEVLGGNLLSAVMGVPVDVVENGGRYWPIVGPVETGGLGGSA